MALLQVNCFSDVLGKCVNFNVILPQRTKNQIGLAGMQTSSEADNDKCLGEYPVLYLLHGMSDDYTCWMRRTSIERYVSKLNLAVVMPDGDLSWYTNTTYEQKYLKHIAEELPAICRDFFPNISSMREKTFIAGNSMGGYGAFKIALTYPERFGYAAGLSAAFSLQDVLEQNIAEEVDTGFWKGIFGSLEHLEESEHAIPVLARKRMKETKDSSILPKLYVCCGTEDVLYASQKEVAEELIDIGYALTYRERNGGHNWTFWDEEIPRVLHWLQI